VIAEGIETADEFRTIRDIGIACGQGYFIARPNRIPPLTPSAEVGCLINTNHAAEQPYGNTRGITVETISRYVEPTPPETEIEKIFATFFRE